VRPASDVEFVNIPGNVPMRVNAPKDIDRYYDGYTNPYLFRLYERQDVPFSEPVDGHYTTFNPYNQTPQFELAPRDYLFYISGTDSYRLTTIHNHDENSEYWEIP